MSDYVSQSDLEEALRGLEAPREPIGERFHRPAFKKAIDRLKSRIHFFGDNILSFEAERVTKVLGSLKQKASRLWPLSQAKIDDMSPELEKVFTTPRARHVALLQHLAELHGFSAYGLDGPANSPFFKGFDKAKRLPVTGLWPFAKGLSNKEKAAIEQLDNLVVDWPVEEPAPWEEPDLIRSGFDKYFPMLRDILKEIEKPTTLVGTNFTFYTVSGNKCRLIVDERRGNKTAPIVERISLVAHRSLIELLLRAVAGPSPFGPYHQSKRDISRDLETFRKFLMKGVPVERLRTRGKAPGAFAPVLSKVGLSNAYYQFGSSPTRIALYDPHRGTWRYFELCALSFGSIWSLFGFVGVSELLTMLILDVLEVPCKAYIDDFLIICCSSLAPLYHRAILELFEVLGIEVTHKANGNFAGRLNVGSECLGLDYTTLWESSLPIEHASSNSLQIGLLVQPTGGTLADIRRHIGKTQDGCKGSIVPVKWLEAMTGSLAFVYSAFRQKRGFSFVYGIYDIIKKAKSHRVAPKSMLKTLADLLEGVLGIAVPYLESGQHYSSSFDSVEKVFAFSDASLRKAKGGTPGKLVGLGGIIYYRGKRHCFGTTFRLKDSPFPGSVTHLLSNILGAELVALLLVVRALRLIDPSFSGYSLWRVDNAAACFGVVKGALKAPGLTPLATLIQAQLGACGHWAIAYLNTIRNRADAFSRLAEIEAKLLSLDQGLTNRLIQDATTWAGEAQSELFACPAGPARKGDAAGPSAGTPGLGGADLAATVLQGRGE